MLASQTRNALHHHLRFASTIEQAQAPHRVPDGREHALPGRLRVLSELPDHDAWLGRALVGALRHPTESDEPLDSMKVFPSVALDKWGAGGWWNQVCALSNKFGDAHY